MIIKIPTSSTTEPQAHTRSWKCIPLFSTKSRCVRQERYLRVNDDPRKKQERRRMTRLFVYSPDKEICLCKTNAMITPHEIRDKGKESIKIPFCAVWDKQYLYRYSVSLGINNLFRKSPLIPLWQKGIIAWEWQAGYVFNQDVILSFLLWNMKDFVNLFFLISMPPVAK